jgi:demethylmenaquinone methyltransferase/2-methoxy-6-polyprenyl-1,4-benzoquinol methylase
MAAPDAVALGSGAMFDRIAPRYDLLNRIISFGLDTAWRARTARSIRPAEPAKLLDLATGTGDQAIALARQHPHATIVGVDPSPRMIELAERKVRARGLAEHVTFAIGSAESLAYEAASFDGVTIAFGIRNVPDRARALLEMRRVLRPGGQIAVLELAEPRHGLMGPLARWHVHHAVPAIGAWLSGASEYRYLQASIERFPAPAELAAMLTHAGFEHVAWSPLTFGVATLYTGAA